MSALVPLDIIDGWVKKAIECMKKSMDAIDEYNKVKPGIVESIELKPYLHGAGEFSVRKGLEVNVTLIDLGKTIVNNRDTANMLNMAVLAQKALREMTPKPGRDDFYGDQIPD